MKYIVIILKRCKNKVYERNYINQINKGLSLDIKRLPLILR